MFWTALIVGMAIGVLLQAGVSQLIDERAASKLRKLPGPSAWERATRPSEDFGPHTLEDAATVSQRLRAIDAEDEIARAIAKGRACP